MQKSACLDEPLDLSASKKEVGTVGLGVKATGSACGIRSALRQPTHFPKKPEDGPRKFFPNLLCLLWGVGPKREH